MLGKGCVILFILHVNYAWVFTEVQPPIEHAPRNNSDISTRNGAPRHNSDISTRDGAPRHNSDISTRDGAPRQNSDISTRDGAPRHNSDISTRDGAPRHYSDNNTADNELHDETENSARFNLIYPGTKWCGAGNIAQDYNDLGQERDTDKCCRDHDNCPDIIGSGETKHNLTNNAFYSKLSCACDEKFLSCLKSVNTKVSKRVGTLYFDAIDTKCYRLDYPIRACVRYCGWMDRKCVQYSYYTDREKKYQWFDVPTFS